MFVIVSRKGVIKVQLISNSKIFILKDGHIKSIWTYLTACPCYTTNTNKQDYTTQTDRQSERQRQRDRDRGRVVVVVIGF